MSIKYQLSFSSGELDPILHDRVTLEKFKTGLATARNVMIGKTGGLLSRFSRAHYVKAKNSGEEIRLFSPPNSSILLEWGNLYVRVYDFSSGEATLVNEVAHTFTESDLPDMHFAAAGKYVYVFVKGSEMLKLLYDDATPALVSSADMFKTPDAPTGLGIVATGTPAGYARDYLVTLVKNGEESLYVEDVSGSYNKPVASTENNVITVTCDASYANLALYNEIRVYSRPNGGGAYGLLGTSSSFFNSAGALKCKYIDLGGLADFTNGIQGLITVSGLESQDIIDMHPKTGAVYQQRLLLGNLDDDEEAILASRPGFQGNFNRDYPYDADSALKFKSGTTGKASVLRIIENDGMIVFTNVGVYISVGTLSSTNIALEKKGPWVIKEEIEPLSIPGGVFFVDKNTNEVKQLIYSQDILTYQVLEQSIFSAHLFRQKTIISWAYQDGVSPIIIVSFSDGTFATYTYNYEHQMKAWTRHDSSYPIEQVEGTAIADSTFFVTNKDGDRYIQVSLPRYISSDVFVANPESDKLAANSFMDAVKSTYTLINDSLVGADQFILVPVVTDDWEGSLTLTCGTSGLFTVGTYGAVGTIMRFFDVTDRTVVDLKVTARASDNEVTVLPSAEFPLAQATGFRLYKTYTEITGLDHLEGENVAIFLDGHVVNSPNNDVERYTAVTVTSGSITLPNNEYGAIVIVGRPITADIKTLNISTVEQAPVLIESLSVNKLYMRINETRGLYISNDFPEVATGAVDGNSVNGMEDLDVFDVPSGTDIIGNRYKTPATKRIEVTLPGNWESNGELSIRQVDPLHFEILSIIPDIEVLSRSNR